MKYLLIIVLTFTFGSRSYSQQVFSLSEELEEISGIERIDQSTYAVINDGGNDPVIYLLSNEGKIIKKVKVNNASNIDWEDLSRDEEFLYIGDFGNNQNKRKNLCIYKVRINDVLQKNSVQALKISFQYEDQHSFPPPKSSQNFDAESLVVKNDSVYIFSKNKTNPWSGITNLYKLPINGTSNKAKVYKAIYIGPDNWLSDAVTSADYYGGKWYLLTYNRIIQLIITEKDVYMQTIMKFDSPTQKESIKVLNDTTIIVADEKHRLLGGGKIYKYKVKL